MLVLASGGAVEATVVTARCRKRFTAACALGKASATDYTSPYRYRVSCELNSPIFTGSRPQDIEISFSTTRTDFPLVAWFYPAEGPHLSFSSYTTRLDL